MKDLFSKTWRRDLFVGALASLLTILVLAPLAWASHHSEKEQTEAARREAQAVAERAEAKVAEAQQQQNLALKTLLEDASALIGLGDKSKVEILPVTTAAVTPEVPKDAMILIDKQAPICAAGDIVIFLDNGRNYLGRVVAVDKRAGRIMVGRNGEKNRDIALTDLLGRGVLNTR